MIPTLLMNIPTPTTTKHNNLFANGSGFCEFFLLFFCYFTAAWKRMVGIHKAERGIEDGGGKKQTTTNGGRNQVGKPPLALVGSLSRVRPSLFPFWGVGSDTRIQLRILPGISFRRCRDYLLELLCPSQVVFRALVGARLPLVLRAVWYV